MLRCVRVNARLSRVKSTLLAIPDLLVSLTKHVAQCLGCAWKFPHLQEPDCRTVGSSISASIGIGCVKGPCRDTIVALWACNVRPSIGTCRNNGRIGGGRYHRYANVVHWTAHMGLRRDDGPVLMGRIETDIFVHVERMNQRSEPTPCVRFHTSSRCRGTIWVKTEIASESLPTVRGLVQHSPVSQSVIKAVDFHLADYSVWGSSWPRRQGTYHRGSRSLGVCCTPSHTLSHIPHWFKYTL